MSARPRNIHRHPDGYLVRIRRGGVTYVAFTKEWDRAVQLRDRFLALAGPDPVRSNTGVRGVTESVRWARGYFCRCFMVSWHRHGRQFVRRVLYGPKCRTREEAFQMACDLRARMDGQPCEVANWRKDKFRPAGECPAGQ